MTITNQDVEIFRGDSALLQVTLTDVNGALLVLSAGGTIKYRMSDNSHSGDDRVHIRKELGNGILLVNGVASVALLSEETDLSPDLYYHELKVYDGGDVATAMTGSFNIRQALRLPQTMQGRASIALNGAVKV